MYLVKKTYVKNYRFTKPEERYQVTVTKGGQPADIKPERITVITEQVAYWRKANHLHKWFVDNVQDGTDDCKEYYVTREQLQELLSLCEQVIAASKLINGKVTNGYTYSKETGEVPIIENGKLIEDASVAQELLPTNDGFFFGSTDYDQWYLYDVQETAVMLKDLLTESEAGLFSSLTSAGRRRAGCRG